MLHTALAVPFPHVGSTGFVAGTCQPCKVIRRNDDGSTLVSLEPRAHQARNRDASGNRTLAPGELCATEREAFETGATIQRATKKNRARK